MNFDGTAFGVFLGLFLLVTVIGFAAVRWRRAESLAHLDEWGLGGRSFGGFVTWFLLGGDLYTAYTFIAVPALLYGAGAIGFFAVPYTIIVYPLIFILMPRLWSVSHRHGYVTPADFVRGRFDSRTLALAVAVTGIVATMPYIALQLVGIEAVLTAMGVHGSGWAKDLPLAIAFAILAAYTYTSGLRAPALIAFVKDTLIYVVILVAVIYIPTRLGGFGHIFDVAQQKLSSPKAAAAGASFIPAGKGYGAYWTLALGSALALFMYPHSITGVLATRDRNVIRRNAAALPAYSLLLGLIALLGFMALAANVVVPKTGLKANLAVPLLFRQMFPSWFAGVGFAAIAIGALVPAAIMSIAAANLFTRNVWGMFQDANASPAREAAVAKIVSLLVKVGALLIILFLKVDYALNFQLIGGILILQTFPAIAFGLYTRWFHRWALLAGWAVGIGTGIAMAYVTPNATGTQAHFGSSVYHWTYLGLDFKAYAALIAFALNVVVATTFTVLLRAARAPAGNDATTADDYEATAVPALNPAPVG
ncbi:MAG: solute:Na+ symporter, family [Frankiaceae bacterium]|jgi:SSS family solute:Na+ symporter|nr:solute:Na+ symporter, family [Frankiaceae bacterium]